jgi:alkylhydroperoxidase/carboxymuconolactone decarboxylase family protein YurZ
MLEHAWMLRQPLGRAFRDAILVCCFVQSHCALATMPSPPTRRAAGPEPLQTASLSDQELERRLSAIRAKRGYLLPHHGLLAITSDHLLQAYDQAYTALALDMKTLSVRDRELVWLGVLIATDEAVASHHIPKFLDGGGTVAEFEAVLRLTALLKGSTAFEFVQSHWERHVEGFDAVRVYRAAVESAAAPLSARDAWLCACSVHAACGRFEWLAHALVAAYDHQVAEADLAEALSIMMFPGSVPYFVEAAKTWLNLIRSGRIQPSPTFAAWAALPGQGGYDEVSQRSG